MQEMVLEPVPSTAESLTTRAVLALEDGALFEGRAFGKVSALWQKDRRGEVVFTTAMTGYQEVCTDPSYRGQMVVMTYPLIGNYGIAPSADESRRPWLSTLIVREYCEEFSSWGSHESLHSFLAYHGIPALSDIDTRALTRHLRDHGTLRGILHPLHPDEEIDAQHLAQEAQRVRNVTELDVVDEVSTPQIMRLTDETGLVYRGTHHIVLIDTGYKQNIGRCLAQRDLGVTLVPHNIAINDLLALQPDGVVLSNGPGDPEAVASLTLLVHALMERRIPVLGICLGHQIIGLAAGATTSRLYFGHHGCNHPVIDVRNGQVTITSQNHNFQVDAASLRESSGFYVSHRNVSDDSVEGLAHRTLPIFSVQYHPEAAPGPQDNRTIFDQFAALISSP